MDSKVFSLSALNSNCPCVRGQKSVKCEIKIIYTTTNGNTQTENRTINAQCVTKSTPVNPTSVVNPIVLGNSDVTPPEITISSPADNTTFNCSKGAFTLQFSIDDETDLDYCEVNDQGRVLLNEGVNANRGDYPYAMPIRFVESGTYDLNIQCCDIHQNCSNEKINYITTGSRCIYTDGMNPIINANSNFVNGQVEVTIQAYSLTGLCSYFAQRYSETGEIKLISYDWLYEVGRVESVTFVDPTAQPDVEYNYIFGADVECSGNYQIKEDVNWPLTAN